MTGPERIPSVRQLTRGQLIVFDRQYASEEMRATETGLIREAFPS
ncbi:unnamed protein product, partial [marine sediment metagenome]